MKDAKNIHILIAFCMSLVLYYEGIRLKGCSKFFWLGRKPYWISISAKNKPEKPEISEYEEIISAKAL